MRLVVIAVPAAVLLLHLPYEGLDLTACALQALPLQQRLQHHIPYYHQGVAFGLLIDLKRSDSINHTAGEATQQPSSAASNGTTGRDAATGTTPQQ